MLKIIHEYGIFLYEIKCITYCYTKINFNKVVKLEGVIMNNNLNNQNNQNSKTVPISMCERGGCLAKVSGSDLIRLVNGAHLIAGDFEPVTTAENPEDAAVVQIDDKTLLLSTDIGPLVGVDGYIAGKIAALHALSDIYVMGGIPTHALVTFVISKTDSNLQAQAVLGGVFSACKSEGVEVSGGHTIKSEESLVGLSVLGKAPESGYIAKCSCESGDVLMVSKPIGTGIALRAVFHGMLGEEALEESISIMTTSNKEAAQAAFSVSVHALTDVTGFGLLGHLSEMLGSEHGADIFLSEVPILSSISQLSHIGIKTSFILDNLEYTKRKHKVKLNISSISELALVDPQTNGAVLVSVNEEKVGKLESYGFKKIGIVNDTKNIVVK